MSEVNKLAFKTAIQLFTVRNTFASDPVGCLKEIKKMGYDGVELWGFGGHDPNYIKGVCDAIGLEIPSIHITIWTMGEDAHGFAEKARVLGLKYAALPYLNTQGDFPGQSSFKELKGEIEKVNREIGKYGVRMLYHNHAAEFDKNRSIGGEILFDVLLNAFPKGALSGELDTCWSHQMGVDPAAYIRKRSGRIPVVHLKDYTEKGRGKNRSFTTCPFGDGKVNSAEVIKAAVETGVEWVVVEEDSPYPAGKSELECAKKSINNIKKLTSAASN